MWDLEPAERLVRYVMSVAVLLTLVFLAFLSMQVNPQQLSPVFASAAPTSDRSPSPSAPHACLTPARRPRCLPCNNLLACIAESGGDAIHGKQDGLFHGRIGFSLCP